MRQHVMPSLDLDRTGDRSLSAQLYDQLHAALLSGALRAGERLPSSRVLAQHLDVSRIVVTDAYDRLTAEGWLDGQHGSGTFVARQSLLPSARMPFDEGGDDAGTQVDLRPGRPWVLDYDRSAWRRAWRSAGDLPLAAGADHYGDRELRSQLAEHLRRSRAVPVRAENIVVTRGTGPGLDLLAATVLKPGARVGIEEPGYQKARNILTARGAELVPVPVDDHGLLVDDLPDGLDLLYTTPAHQYPVGGRLPADRRARLIEWAGARGTLLVEDDYDAEFRYDVTPLPTLWSQAPEQVVLLGTLSKSLSPDVGLGWLIAAPGLLARVVERREDLSDRTPGPVQRAVSTLMSSGDLDRHLHRMRKEYARRRGVIVELLGDRVKGEAAGLHVLIEVGSARDVVSQAASRGILLDTLDRHYLGVPRREGLVVGYGSADLTGIERACRVLADVLAGTA